MSLRGGSKPRILLVEDNQNIRGAFAVLLEESGYQVHQAGSGAEALSEAEAARPNLILMDLGLPDGSGLDFTRKLKADPRTKDAVIIAITGRAFEADEAACLAAGCAGYLAKPVGTEALLASIAEVMASREDGTGNR